MRPVRLKIMPPTVEWRRFFHHNNISGIIFSAAATFLGTNVETIGYAHLIEKFQLAALPLPVTRVVTSALTGRRTRDHGGKALEEFGPSYRPEPTMLAHLRFALRY